MLNNVDRLWLLQYQQSVELLRCSFSSSSFGKKVIESDLKKNVVVKGKIFTEIDELALKRKLFQR